MSGGNSSATMTRDDAARRRLSPSQNSNVIASKDSSESDEENIDLLKEMFKNRDVPGRRPGGRFWKEDRKRLKLSSVERSERQKRLRLEERMKRKQEMKHAQELSRSILDCKADAKRLRRERREENKKNKEMNQKKSEIVQVITNTAKLKKIKNKKQLRSIEKRDTTGMV